MNSKTIEQIVIESMEPTFAEQIGTETSEYWDEYSSELGVLDAWSHTGFTLGDLNSTLRCSMSSTGYYNAACDVASTLEVLCPEKYAGKFTY